MESDPCKNYSTLKIAPVFFDLDYRGSKKYSNDTPNVLITGLPGIGKRRVNYKIIAETLDKTNLAFKDDNA